MGKGGDWSDETLTAAHKHASFHRGEIEKSNQCGCFYCKKIFLADDIVDWVQYEPTAFCPHCPVDAVIGDASGFPITIDFLSAMHNRWFMVSDPDDRLTPHAKTKIWRI
ncbi:MAG: cytoplasmic protein [Pseudomonadota bacterium]